MESRLLVVALFLAVCCVIPGIDARWFDPHHEYHYTYSARTQTWLDHEIITVIKVCVDAI